MIQGMFKLSVMGSGFSQGFTDVCACDTQKSDCGCGDSGGGCGCGGGSSNKIEKIMKLFSSRVTDVTSRTAKDDFWNREKYSATLRTLGGDVTVVMISTGANGGPVIDWGGGGPSGIPDGGFMGYCINYFLVRCAQDWYCSFLWAVCSACVLNDIIQACKDIWDAAE